MSVTSILGTTVVLKTSPLHFVESGAVGWLPNFKTVEDGDRTVMQLVGWSGGSGDVPVVDVDKYLGEDGFVTDIAQATNLKGTTGQAGNVPWYIPSGQSYYIPLYEQRTTFRTIVVDGILRIDGILVDLF